MSATKTPDHLPLSKIAAPPESQARVKLDDDAVARYAAAYDNGEKLPPLVVFGPDENDIYILGDGFQRREAAQVSGKKALPVEVRKGGLREAILFAVGANATHGLPRTEADRRRAVTLLLEDSEYGKKSGDWLAKHCRVSKAFALSVKKAHLKAGGKEVEEKPARSGKAKGGRPKKDAPPNTSHHESNGVAPTRSLPAAKADKKGMDDYGREIPKALTGAFADGDAGNAICITLADLINEVKTLADTEGGVLLAKAKIDSELKTVREGIQKVMPAAVCIPCEGAGEVEGKKCQQCRGRGWVNAMEVNAAPNAIRKLYKEAKAALGKE